MPDSRENHQYRVFLAEFYESELKILVIRPSDCDLKYHFGPKVLEYGRKKLYLLRFPQLVFVITSPLSFIYLSLFFLENKLFPVNIT